MFLSPIITPCYRWDIYSLSKEGHICNYPNNRVGTGWHIKCVGIWELHSSIANDLIDNEDPKHTLFCCKIAFVEIYTLFSFLWWRLLKSWSRRMRPPGGCLLGISATEIWLHANVLLIYDSTAGEQIMLFPVDRQPCFATRLLNQKVSLTFKQRFNYK